MIFTYLLYYSLIYSKHKKTNDSFNNEMFLQAVILSDNIEDLFNDYIQNIALIMFYLGEKGVDPTLADLKRFYNSTNKSRLSLLNIAFLDNNGTCMSIYPEKYSPEIGLNYSFRDYFQKVKNTEVIVTSKPMENFRPHKDVPVYGAITIIAPLIDNNEKKLGFVRFDVNIYDLIELIHNEFQRQRRKLAYFIVDTVNNEIISSTQNIQPKNLSIENDKFRSFIINFAKEPNNEDKYIQTKISGKKAFFASCPLNIGNNSLTVVATLPYEGSIVSTTDFFNRLSVVMIFTTLILFFGLGFIIYHEFIVKKLKKKISHLEIIIDKKTHKQNIDDIVQTDYFKELSEKLKSIKKD